MRTAVLKTFTAPASGRLRQHRRLDPGALGASRCVVDVDCVLARCTLRGCRELPRAAIRPCPRGIGGRPGEERSEYEWSEGEIGHPSAYIHDPSPFDRARFNQRRRPGTSRSGFRRATHCPHRMQGRRSRGFQDIGIRARSHVRDEVAHAVTGSRRRHATSGQQHREQRDCDCVRDDQKGDSSACPALAAPVGSNDAIKPQVRHDRPQGNCRIACSPKPCSRVVGCRDALRSWGGVGARAGQH